MLFFLKSLLAFLIIDYLILRLSRVADRTRFIEVYKNRNVYVSYRHTAYGYRIIYTVDVPYVFYPANDYYAVKAYSLQEIRFKIDNQRNQNVRIKFLSPLRKMKVIK